MDEMIKQELRSGADDPDNAKEQVILEHVSKSKLGGREDGPGRDGSGREGTQGRAGVVDGASQKHHTHSSQGFIDNSEGDSTGPQSDLCDDPDIDKTEFEKHINIIDIEKFEKLMNIVDRTKEQGVHEIMFSEIIDKLRSQEGVIAAVEKMEEKHQKNLKAGYLKWEAELKQQLEQREDGRELSSLLSRITPKLKHVENATNKVGVQLVRAALGLEVVQDNLLQELNKTTLQVDTDILREIERSPEQMSKLMGILRSQHPIEQCIRFMERLNKAGSILEQQASKLLDDAMEKGYVTSQHIVLVLTGIAGSGKSSFKRVVLDLPPEEVRVSTPLAEATVRNVSISRATATGSDSVKWEEVTSEELLTMVADAVKEVGDPQKSPLPTFFSAVRACCHSNTDTSTFQPGNTAHIKDDNCTASNPSTFQDDTAHISTANHHPDLKARYDPLLKLIIMSKGSRRLLGVRWVYIIDTGGQPQFLRLLPAFIKNISACVCVVRLDQDLDHKPEIQFFDKSGKQCGDSQQSERTNLQVIESCLRTIHTQSYLGSNNSPPSCFVVGTHLDEYEKHPHLESIEQKNERLVTRLNPLLEKCLTFYQSGEECDKLIFPLNCKTPEQRDKEVAAEFRKCVMRQSCEPEGKIPLAWFVLEQRIRQHAAKKNVSYVKKKICIKIARRLKMSEEVFEAALDHLLKLNIFHCYPSLPNLIFCDTQVVLLKLTELVQYCFHLKTTAIGISGEDLSFKNEGIITLKFLTNPHFCSFYSKLFTPKNFLDILLSLLTVAHLQDEKYFMPCLLKELSEKEVSTHRTTSKSLSPLLIYIDQGCLPNGLFASLISSLKNNHGWSLAYQRGHKPSCLHQNCITFTLKGGIPGSVSLIESFSYLEIHLNCSIEHEVDNTCAKIFQDIKSGLEESWRVLYSNTKKISLKLAFFCSSCPSSLSPDDPPEARDHYATVSTCGKYETCSLVPDQGVVLCESKLRWLRNTNYSQAEPFAANIKSPGVGIPQDNPSCDLQSYLSSLPDAASSCLDKLLDWDNNYDRDLITIAEHLLEWEELLAVPFQLTATQISDIKEKYIYKPALQRRAVLETWKSKSALQATYRNLMKTLVDAKHIRGARAVCEVLKKHQHNL